MNKVLVLLLIACFIVPQIAFGGAWTLPRNNTWFEWYMKANWAKYDYDTDCSPTKKNNDARSWGWSMIPKAEYGVTDWFTLLGGLEYKEGKYKEYARNPAWNPYSVKNHAVTEVQVGGRVRLLEEPVVFSVQVKGFIYTGYVENDPDWVQEYPGLSDRCDMLEIRALVGKFFNTRVPCYFGAETGYRFKNRGVANDVPFFVEGGFWPLKWLLIKSEVDGYWLSPDSNRRMKKGYAIWRIGPVIQLLTIYHMLTGVDVTSKEYTSDVTKEGYSFNVETQYGYTIWGANTSLDQEVVLKISAQF